MFPFQQFFLMQYIFTFQNVTKLYFKKNEYSNLRLSLICLLIFGIKVCGDLLINFNLVLAVSMIFILKTNEIFL